MSQNPFKRQRRYPAIGAVPMPQSQPPPQQVAIQLTAPLPIRDRTLATVTAVLPTGTTIVFTPAYGVTGLFTGGSADAYAISVYDSSPASAFVEFQPWKFVGYARPDELARAVGQQVAIPGADVQIQAGFPHLYCYSSPLGRQTHGPSTLPGAPGSVERAQAALDGAIKAGLPQAVITVLRNQLAAAQAHG